MSEIFDFEEIEEAEEKGFVIDNDSKAEWALKKVLAEKEERERLLSLIKAERENLDMKEEQIERRYEQKTSFLLSKLHAYLDTVNCKKTKTQETYQLLSGKLVRKFPKQKLVPIEEKLLEWCKQNAPECVKTTENAAWSEVKEKFTVVGENVVCTETGEFVDCVGVLETPSVFDVTG